MSTVSSLLNGKTLISVKGAPETIKTMLTSVPDKYDDTFKWYTRRGSRVLALAMKELPTMNNDKVRPGGRWLVCTVLIVNASITDQSHDP
jgi:cation-transporting ATPase 13A1